MSKYLVIPRRADSPMTHAGGSTEETVCEIAKNLLHYPGPSDYLMAIPADTKIATFAVLKDDAFCSLEITPKTLDTWRNDVVFKMPSIHFSQLGIVQRIFWIVLWQIWTRLMKTVLDLKATHQVMTSVCMVR